MTLGLIVPAAGIGSRFCSDIKKQFFLIDEKPIFYWTLKNLLKCYPFDEVIIGLNDEDLEYVSKILHDLGVDKNIVKFAKGGKERADTVLNCLNEAGCETVLVHDAVRPFVSQDVVLSLVRAMSSEVGAICAVGVSDTVKFVKDGYVEKTIPRANVYLAHTPQAFNRLKLIKAIECAISSGVNVTDESSAMEHAGYKVKILPSTKDNIKITFQSDVETINILKKKYFYED